jgi:hypothetical protein
MAEVEPMEGDKMGKRLLAAALIGGIVTPAWAEQIYVVFDPVSHKCLLVHDQPSPGMRLLGIFKAKPEAKTAMASMKACRGKPS